MHNDFFKSIEYHPSDQPIALQTVLDQVVFNDQGLLPVIVQEHQSGQILMFAWMNQEALARTLESQQMTYWSRSRQDFWLKGETSGHFQTVKSMSLDCDGDALLCQVEQIGAACHTQRKHCFYLKLDAQNKQVWVSGLSQNGEPDHVD